MSHIAQLLICQFAPLERIGRLAEGRPVQAVAVVAWLRVLLEGAEGDVLTPLRLRRPLNAGQLGSATLGLVG